jgi:hypothetical protein
MTYQLGVSDTRNVFEKLKIVDSEGTPNFELIPIALKSELGSSKINLGLVIANKIKNNNNGIKNFLAGTNLKIICRTETKEMNIERIAKNTKGNLDPAISINAKPSIQGLTPTRTIKFVWN